MNTNDLTPEHSIDEILDTYEEERVSYTTEELDGYFICSRHYWDGLSPSEQAELLSQHPHLQDYFEE